MNIALTFHIPVKFNRDNKGPIKGVFFYLPIPNWWFNIGKGFGKTKWIRLAGITFWVSYWKLWPIEISLRMN